MEQQVFDRVRKGIAFVLGMQQSPIVPAPTNRHPGQESEG